MYAIIKVSNGSFSVAAEGIKTIENAIVQYHGIAQTLWNAADVTSGCLMIVDEKLNIQNGYKENIIKEQAED